VLRQGDGEPLVLFHGILCAGRVWRNVVPLLAPHFDAIAPTELGHLGGPACDARPVTFEEVVDDAERLLDELGLGKAHLAGNSLGGWISLELARRGRAKTVCALSPAGAWDRDWRDKDRIYGSLRTAQRDTRRSRRLLPLLARSARFRRWTFSEIAVHGDRVSRADYLEFADDAIGCSILEDIIEDTAEAQLAPLDPPPCPITLAWSGEDRIFPVDPYGSRARQMIPGARFLVLDGVGHVPMHDDPKLVAETILAATEAATTGGQPETR
jgi:pimeloyl-ACP methyl ester carboxylesterase